MARVVLVVPCFNEADRLPLDQFRSFLLASHELHFLFVNDGSTDRTSEVLGALRDEAPERFDVLDLDSNRGKAEAVRRGVQRALSNRFDYVGYWDADLATPLIELPQFCEQLDVHDEAEAVFGSRVRLLGRTIERRAYRHAYGRVFATAVATLLGLPVYDTQCGAKLFRATEDFARVFAEPFVSRWIFDVEILVRYIALWEPQGIEVGERVYELPLRQWRHVGGSKIGAGDAAAAFVDLGRIATKYRSHLALRHRQRGRH